MKLSIRLLIVSTLLVFTSNSALATGSAGVDSSESQKTDRRSDLSTKQNKEKGKIKGKRKSTTESTGNDKQWQDTKRDVENEQKSTSADISLPLESVFVAKIMELEKSEVEPFHTCQLMSKPRLPKHFGLSAQAGEREVDSYKSQAMTSLSQSGTLVSELVDDTPIRYYRNCLAAYGAIIGQSYINLTSGMKQLQVKNNSDKEGRERLVGIGYGDFVAIAEEALDKVKEYGIKEKSINTLMSRTISEDVPCSFAGSIDRIQCGSSLVVIGAQPQLFAAGGTLEMYGHAFSGYRGEWKMNRSYSMSQSVERMASTSRYEKFAKDVNRYAEEMERQGKSLEAAKVRSVALEQMKSGKVGLSLDGLLPGIHGQ
jgi:hypothetical protein